MAECALMTKLANYISRKQSRNLRRNGKFILPIIVEDRLVPNYFHCFRFVNQNAIKCFL